MSFIRCGSSPEGLYVFGSEEGIEFYWWNGDRSRVCFGERHSMCFHI